MTATKYTYAFSAFPNSKVEPSSLTAEIGASAIVTALDFIDTNTACDIWFKDPLSGGDQTLLGQVVAAHQGVSTSSTERVVRNNATLTSSGSMVLTGFTTKDITLVVNVKSAPTGTNPSLTFYLQEVDPVDQTTAIGSTETGTVITSASTQIVPFIVQGSAVRVGWTIAGTNPSFTGVNASISVKTSSSQVVNAQDAPGSALHRFGNLTATSVSEVLVATRAYAEPGSQAQRSVVSTSATDSDILGTGARQVRIVYLDSNYVRYTEDVNLTGNVAVNTVGTNIRFIESMTVIKGTDAVGAIRLMSSTGGGGTEVCGIGAFSSDTFLCHHYVPAGRTATVFGWGAVISDDCNLKLRGQKIINGNRTDMILDLDNSAAITSPGRSEFRRNLYGVKLSPKTYVRVTVVPGQATSTVIRSYLDLIETDI